MAIAAKAYALAKLGCASSPKVTLIEANSVGAIWLGLPRFGYSNGSQDICTRPERDIGFPYIQLETEDDDSEQSFNEMDAEIFPGLAAMMYAEFSFPRYLIESSTYDYRRLDHSSWVSRGQNSVSHLEFGRYLSWVAKKCLQPINGTPVVSLIEGKVESMAHSTTTPKWRISYLERSREDTLNHVEADGVVITGNGEARTIKPLSDSNLPELLFNMRDFWARTDEILTTLKSDYISDLGDYTGSIDNDEYAAAIIGAGGGSAAIALYLAKNLPNQRVCIIGENAALFGKASNYFTERLYGINSVWNGLTARQKVDHFIKDQTGVVWDRIISDLSQCENVDYIAGRCEDYQTIAGPTPMVELTVDQRSKQLLARFAIDAIGFDFKNHVLSFIEDSALNLAVDRCIDNLSARAAQQNPETQLLNINTSFELLGENIPRGLHVPDRGSFIGPAATNLMALGWVSRQIILEYM